MRVLSTMALVGAGLALTACASSGGRSGRDGDREPVRALMSADAVMFVSFDADGDLRTTYEETAAGIARELARADANHDGALQPIEFQNWSAGVLGGTQMGPYRLDFDRNVDNTITGDEFRTEIEARAHDYDANADGALARSEFVRLLGQARPPQPPGPGVLPGAQTRRPDGR